MITWLCAAAFAAPPTATPFWAGQWGLDPSRSDDPVKIVEDAFVVPVATTSTSSRQLAPDGGESDSEDDRQKALDSTLALLGRSGRCSLAPAGEQIVSVDWGDGHPIAVPEGGKWVKVTPTDGDRYRIRVQEGDGLLLIERRYKNTTLSESWLAPKEADATERAVVVQIIGPTLSQGVEFRRIYRKLAD